MRLFIEIEQPVLMGCHVCGHVNETWFCVKCGSEDVQVIVQPDVVVNGIE